MIVVWPFLAISRVCLQLASVVFPDQTHSLFFEFLWSMDLNACKSIILKGGLSVLETIWLNSYKACSLNEESTESKTYKMSVPNKDLAVL